MEYRYHLLHRRPLAHYSFMLASLLLLAGCATGDLTQSSELPDAEMTSADAIGEARSHYLAAIIISPDSVSMQPGATQRFTATAKFKDGRTLAGHVRWTATGGKIDENGLFT